MSCDVAYASSIKMFMLCLLTCTAYRVTLIIDMICTKVSCCDDCVVMSWFTLVLILFTSFVVAVPVSHLRASLRKGSRLLLQQLIGCGWLDWSSFTVDVMVDSAELYTSLILDSSS